VRVVVAWGAWRPVAVLSVVGSDRILHLYFSLPALIVVTRFLWPLHVPVTAKVVVAILLLVASQYHLWSRISSGSVFAPEFPRPMVILFNWAFGAILFLAALQLLLDVTVLTTRQVVGGRVHAPDAVRYGLAAVAAITAAIGVRHALVVPPLKDIELAIPQLPRPFDGYTMLQLTDLHISRLFPEAWARAVVTRSNALGVDVIVVTGDLIDGTLAMRRDDIEPLRGLRAVDGVYVIPGNHEYYFGYRAWMDHYAGMGMHLLENTHTVLNRSGERLVLAGVTDHSARARGQARPNLAQAIAGAPTGVPLIVLDHQPGGARGAAKLGAALQLSGHTHGGMVIGIDRLTARGNAGYVSGAYDVDGMVLYVNNGTALWPGFALRLGRASELTRITLRRAGD
jgi:predicted MPP superfamily phosphohydrolase